MLDNIKSQLEARWRMINARSKSNTMSTAREDYQTSANESARQMIAHGYSETEAYKNLVAVWLEHTLVRCEGSIDPDRCLENVKISIMQDYKKYLELVDILNGSIPKRAEAVRYPM